MVAKSFVRTLEKIEERPRRGPPPKSQPNWARAGPSSPAKPAKTSRKTRPGCGNCSHVIDTMTAEMKRLRYENGMLVSERDMFRNLLELQKDENKDFLALLAMQDKHFQEYDKMRRYYHQMLQNIKVMLDERLKVKLDDLEMKGFGDNEIVKEIRGRQKAKEQMIEVNEENGTSVELVPIPSIVFEENGTRTELVPIPSIVFEPVKDATLSKFLTEIAIKDQTAENTIPMAATESMSCPEITLARTTLSEDLTEIAIENGTAETAENTIPMAVTKSMSSPVITLVQGDGQTEKENRTQNVEKEAEKSGDTATMIWKPLIIKGKIATDENLVRDHLLQLLEQAEQERIAAYQEQETAITNLKKEADAIESELLDEVAELKVQVMEMQADAEYTEATRLENQRKLEKLLLLSEKRTLTNADLKKVIGSETKVPWKNRLGTIELSCNSVMIGPSRHLNSGVHRMFEFEKWQ